jgi:hypothetical protein
MLDISVGNRQNEICFLEMTRAKTLDAFSTPECLYRSKIDWNVAIHSWVDEKTNVFLQVCWKKAVI